MILAYLSDNFDILAIVLIKELAHLVDIHAAAGVCEIDVVYLQ